MSSSRRPLPRSLSLGPVAKTAWDSVTSQIVTEVTAVEMRVGEFMGQVPVRPSAYALNEVRGTMGQARTGRAVHFAATVNLSHLIGRCDDSGDEPGLDETSCPGG
jgi:hypothetical protein